MMFKKFFLNHWPIWLAIVLVIAFFWKFFLRDLIPMPADITVGLYFPWLDYKWGFPTGVPVKNPLPSDIPSLLYPWRMLVIENLKNFTFPLWNPFYFTGMPLLGNFQSATFSWVNIFFAFLPAVKAWSLGIIIQPLLTILFTFLFLRNLKINKIASFLGGIVFSFSAFSLTWLEYNVHGHAAMFLPLLLLMVDKIIEKRQIKWALISGVLLTLSIFSGYPQIVFYSLTAVGFYALFRLFGFWKKERNLKQVFTSSGLLIFFVLLGVLLSAIQWIPGWEALGLSVREIDPIASLSSGGFLPWRNLVTFLAPDFFGNPATYNFWGSPWYDNFALYVGILPLILAFLAIFSRKGKEVWLFLFLSVFALFLALPTPIGKWVADVGIYGVKSISSRIIFLLDFSLAILAAFGLNWLLDKKSKFNFSIYFVIGFFVLIFIALWGFVFFAKNFYPQAEWLIHLSISKRNLILPSLLLIASAGLFFFLVIFRKWKFVKLTFAWLVIILIVFDLFRFGWKYLSFSKTDLVFPTTPVIEFLKEQEKPFRVEFGETIPQNMWMPYKLESAAGYDAMAPLRSTQFLGAVMTERADTPYGRVAQVENYDSKLFDLLNIKYVLAVKYDENGIRNPDGNPKPIFGNQKFELVFEEKSVQVYENRNVLPRAFLVHEVVVKENDQDIIDQMLDPKFDLSKTVVLEENVGLSESKIVLKEDEVTWLSYNQNSSVIKTDSENQGILFVGNSFYPGWYVKVDGEINKIYRANFAFVAVMIPEGRHLVEFYYQPKSFLYGGLISLFTLANFFLFWLVLTFRKLWQRK